jgi:hypothetical protein
MSESRFKGSFAVPFIPIFGELEKMRGWEDPKTTFKRKIQEAIEDTKLKVDDCEARQLHQRATIGEILEDFC